jgi:hypothetical protein
MREILMNWYPTLKRFYPVKIGLILCLCLIIVACSGDSTTDSTKDDPIQITTTISKTIGRLEICIDPRIELINIVENAKSFKEKQLREPTMQQETSNYFLVYKNHPAVEMMQELKAMGFTYTKPRLFILGCTNPAELKPLYPLKQTYPYNDWIPDEGKLAEFTQKLKDFYNDTKFGMFYHKHQVDYERLPGVVSADFEKRDYVKLLEDYFGEKKYRYVFIYSPTTPGGFGSWISSEGKTTAYSIMFSGYVPLVLHEFGHDFVNPVIDEFKDEINQYENLLPPIQKDLPSCYNNWLTVVNEHIIRAFTARVETILDGEEAGKRALDNEVSNGFKYVIPIYELLKEYEANRDKYPDFRRFFPRIIGLFAELSSSENH